MFDPFQKRYLDSKYSISEQDGILDPNSDERCSKTTGLSF